MFESRSCITCKATESVELMEGDIWEFEAAGDNPAFTVSGIVCYHCKNCGEKFVTGELDKINQPKIIEAKRRARGLLSGEEIGKIPAKVGLSAKELETILGFAPNTFSRWKTAAMIQSPSSDALLIMIQAHPEMIFSLALKRGIPVTGRQKGRPSKTILKKQKA